MHTRRPGSCWLVLVLVLLSPASAGKVRAQELTGEQVKRAIRRGVSYLRSRQQADGNWPTYRLASGTTALAVLAMLNAGVPKDDPAVRAALRQVAVATDRFTYVVSLKVMALAEADAKGYAAVIQRGADFLARSQLSNGAWTYQPPPRGNGDHSNTQFALLGLHAASQGGAKIAPSVWRKAERHWSLTQKKDGGWGYGGHGSKRETPTGSMTAAGVASLYIVGGNLATRRERGFKNGKAPGCGQYAQNEAIAGGLAWLTRHFSVDTNPGSGRWLYYYLYALERVGMLTGMLRFGRHDWYREGAARLVVDQRADGSWGGTVYQTSFALLFLGKGHRSILIHKLRWSRTNAWQQDRNDAAHLSAWLGDKLGQSVTWQVVDLGDPVEKWLEAPILYFNGHRFPKFTEDQAKKLRRYVELGGTILAEACCGMEAFTSGMRAFAGKTFAEWPFRELEADHPLYHAMYDLKQADFELEGIGLGCRTSVIFSPRDLSCLWEQGDIPILSERAFRMGANIAAYATGREVLRDRLSVVQLPGDKPKPGLITQGGLQLGQVVHDGGWRPAPYALPNLAAVLNQRANVDVVTKPVPVALDEKTLFNYPIIYMVGQYAFKLSQAELEGLRRYLKRGGFLFADACCGREAFDKAFRGLMREMFGPNALQPLAETHPILSGQIGYDISRVKYQPILQRKRPELTKPVLEGVQLEGRTAVVYSRYDLGCALEGHKCYYCPGYVRADAERVAVNIILYALSY